MGRPQFWTDHWIDCRDSLGDRRGVFGLVDDCCTYFSEDSDVGKATQQGELGMSQQVTENIRTKTINGSKVEILGTLGVNHVLVKVLGRDSLAQVDAADLIKPEDELPKELAMLKFHTVVSDKDTPVGEEK